MPGQGSSDEVPPVKAADPSPTPKQKKAPVRAPAPRAGARGGLTPLGFGLRFAAAVGLVFGTFNPSGHSYYHWVAGFEGGSAPGKILIGLLLLVGWGIFFRATARSLGVVGAVLAASVFGVMLWWLIDADIVDASNASVMSYAILTIISAILTLGLSGSFIWRRLTGQYHVSDGSEGEDGDG